MTFTVKDWRNATTYAGGGDESTPLSAEALEDLETRVTDYTDDRFSDLVLDVRDFGADPAGGDDSTAAIQAAIDQATGAADPATTSRTPTAAIYLPAGRYLVSDTLLVRSAISFRLYGDGQYSSKLVLASGTSLDTLLDLDGVALSHFSDFGIVAEDTASGTNADKAIHLRWSTSANRSTTRNTFRDMFIGELRFRIGFAVEQDDGVRQNDECLFDNVTVAGSWTAGEASWWQYGFRFGDDSAGNTFNMHGLKCNVLACARGASWNGSGGSWIGGGMQQNGTDFYQRLPHHILHIQDIRCETSERLLEGYGATGVQGATVLENIQWDATELHADDRFIDYQHVGTLNIIGLIVHDAAVDPLIRVNGIGGGVLSINGMVCRTAPSSLVYTDLGNVWQWEIRNYLQGDGATSFTANFPGNALRYQTIAATDVPAVDSWFGHGVEVMRITGTANITTMAANAAWAGRKVTLIFNSTASGTGLTDGSNLKLNGNFVYTADDTISLVCDGTNWYETGRSVN